MIRLLPQSRLARALASIAALFALYTLLGFFAAPPLIQRTVAKFAVETLGRKASVGEVRVNPLLFRLEMRELRVAESDGRPIAGFARFYADFELSSLARRAWTFSEIALDKPEIHAEIAPDGRLNLAVLMGRLPRPEPPPDDRLPRLLLERVAVSGGKLAFSDRSDPTPASTTVEPINLELTDLSTLPDHRGETNLKARLADGGSVTWRGAVTLEPLASEGEVRVAGAKPVTVWRFLRDELDVVEPRGELDWSARYRFSFTGGAPALALEAVRVAARGVAIGATGGKAPMLALASVEARDGRFDLAAREIVVPVLELRDGVVAAAVDAQGGIDWARLVKGSQQGRTVAPGAKPWKASIETLKVAGLRLHYTDQSRRRPIRVEANDVTVGLSAALETGTGGTRATLEKIAVTLSNPSLQYTDSNERPIAFESIALDGGRLDLGEQQVTLGRVAIRGGEVKISRNRAGAVPVLDGLLGRDAGLLRREIGAALEQAKKEGRPWRVALDAFDIGGTRLALSDQSFGTPVTYDAEIQRARMTGYRSDGKGPVKFEGALRVKQGGSAAASGTLRSGGEAFSARVRLERLNIKPLHPVLASRVRAVLASGEVSADVKAEYRARRGRHELRASGAARVDNLLVDEADGGERLVGWKSLAATGLRLSLAPDELKIEEARLAGLGAKIVVDRDRSVNLAKIVIAEPPADKAAAADGEAVFPVTVERVAVENGNVNFTDLSLVLPFAANVTDIQGTVQGISSDRASRAAVGLEGRVDEFGLARLNGSLRPFRPRSFLDLNAVFRNVEMPPLSPYTVTFAGRRIAAGRLSLDLQYKIDEGVLAGENRVELNKLQLGERVEAPGALSLPLDLAVALLSDSQGRIQVSVPVRGNVNDPQFSYGHLIWQAIANLITRIITAPFRALGALFGAGGESLEAIAFDPGRAALSPPEREKLKRVAEALAQRPQLRLVAEGQHGAADRAALQQRDVALAVATRLGRAPAPGAAPDPVNIGDAKTQRALEAIFVERQSQQALQQFISETERARGKPVERANAALALVGRGSADHAFYQALLARLQDSALVPDDALRQLAGARARAVTEHLATAHALPAERVAAQTAAASGVEQVKLTLEAIAGAAGKE